MPNETETTSRVLKGLLIGLGIFMAILLVILVILNNDHLEQYKSAVTTISQNELLIHDTQEKVQTTRLQLDKTTQEYGDYKTQAEGHISQLSSDLTATQTTLATKVAQLSETTQKLDETSAKLKTVESQKDELAATLESMKTEIEGYNAQITQLNGQLQTETKEKKFLLERIKDIEAKRDQLMKQWNDLASLRNQVRTLVTAERIRQREVLAEKRGFFGTEQKSGLREFKTYDEVKKDKPTGATVIEVHRVGENPAPKAPAQTPSDSTTPPPAPQPPQK